MPENTLMRPEPHDILRSNAPDSRPPPPMSTESGDPIAILSSSSTKANRKAQVEFLRNRMELRSQAPDFTANTKKLSPEDGVIDFMQTTSSLAQGPSNSADSMRSTSSVYSQQTVQHETASQSSDQDETAFLQYMRAAFEALDSAFRARKEDEQTHGPQNPGEMEDSVMPKAKEAMNAPGASRIPTRPSSADNGTSAVVEGGMAHSDDAQVPSGSWRAESQFTVPELYHKILKNMNGGSTDPSGSVHISTQAEPGATPSVLPSANTGADFPVDPSTFPEPLSPTASKITLRTLTCKASEKLLNMGRK